MTHRVADPRHGAIVEARAGEPLEIALPENPTTGYLWHVEGAPEELGQPTAAEFERGGEAVGAGGTRVFRFLPRGPANADVTFELRRPRGPDVADRRTVRFVVEP